jgi:tRNA (guanine26-N2/guanine27-N2)-dimethyltransferase
MSSELDVQAPRTDNVIEHLRDKGYIVSRTHFEPTGVRTDAPFEDVREAIREESTSNT